MSRPLRVLSLYEGFFAGGARILHTDVVAGLHERGDQQHSVLSLTTEARRESTVQSMYDDPRYQRLIRAGVGVRTLGRTGGATVPTSFSPEELERAAEVVAETDVILSLKEQPLGLLMALRDRGILPQVPVVACLHRSDPTHSGPALAALADAAASGVLTAKISCAQATSDAYARYVPWQTERHVITNGIDTARFRPGTSAEIAATRGDLGIPVGAPVIVFAARFDAMKNPGLFLRAVATHATAHPDTHYVLCGAGMTESNDALTALRIESGVSSTAHVHALGIRDDMPSIYQAADIVALTSAFGEAAPLCLIEGAACGATPVTTGVGDSALSVAGIGLVTTHDADDIAANWAHVLAHRAVFRDAAISARPRLDRERMIEEYRTVVSGLAAARRIAA